MSTDNSHHSDSHRTIIKSTSIISAGTLSSRILGFFRDVLLAKILGTGSQADALFVAFRIPNLLRDFVGEGATNSAVVPVLSEYMGKDNKKEFWNLISVILILAFIILSVLTVLGIWLAPWIVRAIAPGFSADPEKFDLTVRLTKLIFPYLIFIGLTAYCMAILYTFRVFLVSAFSPCLLNLAMIISALAATALMKDPVYVLAIGILVGGFLQLVVHFPSLVKIGIKFQIPTTLRHAGAKRVFKLLIPRMVGAGVYQLTVFIDTFCASLSAIVGPGGISAVYYANRLIQFPMGLFPIAIASAVLPSLSGFAVNGKMDEMKKMIIFSLENTFFIMFPTTILMMALSHPMIRILFERGEFDQYSTMITSSSLLFFSIGLFSFGGIKILVTVFHALQDTKTPVQVAAACLLINGGLNFVLMYPMKVAGIAFASSIAATIDFLVLFYLLSKRLGGGITGKKRFVFKTLVAAALMGIIIRLGWKYYSFPFETVKLGMFCVLGYILYGFFCFQLKVEQARTVWKWARDFKLGPVIKKLS